jgi:broad specificity phosphatase PhoE
VHGWETAKSAQERIVAAVDAALGERDEGDLLFVGHGTVGTLLACHWAGAPISGKYRQSEAGGNVFSVDVEADAMLYGWRTLESLVA